MLRQAVTDRVPDRRKLLVRAAIRVFARKGFHDSRVSDIAEEAGVAHGLLYHYFKSKDDVLETIFRETWTALAGETVRIQESGVALREQLRRFATIFLGSWIMTPSLVRVIVREVGRNPEVGSRVGELREVFVGLRGLLEAAKERGELRADADPLLATWAFYGALEQILTGWAMGQMPSDDEDVDNAVATVVDVFASGLAA
jgi:TetR/AcrR family fatty acid metabolism transcriptional regulator